MHKHPITVVTQKKWYRLVHEFALRAHSVSRRHQNALSSLVESREGFSTTKYLLIVLQLKSRRNATCKITRTTHKGKWNGSDETCWISDVLRACKQAPALIVDLDVPWLLDNSHSTMRACIDNFTIVFFNSPRLICRNGSCKHHRLNIVKR